MAITLSEKQLAQLAPNARSCYREALGTAQQAIKAQKNMPAIMTNSSAAWRQAPHAH